ncbi:MAG: cytochrome c biogenesis protein CcsA [Verrucomicrobiota bacterium]|nr:cytochrome c biogenesis protein CcsA [Verrucomicrobiota bacterium]
MKKESNRWQRWVPWALVAIFSLWVLSTIFPRKSKGEYNIREFAEIPVLLNGRIQPIDSVARNALLVFQGKQSVAITNAQGDKVKLPAIEWLLEVTTRPEIADTRPIFRIDHPEIKGLLKLDEQEKQFTFNQIKEGWGEIEKQARRITDLKIEPEVRTPFEKGIMKLNFSLGLYFRLKNSLQPESSGDFQEEISVYRDNIKNGLVALQKHQSNEEYNEEDLALMTRFFRRYQMMSQIAYPLAVPPRDLKTNPDGWVTIGGSLLESMRSGEIHPAVNAFAAMSTAYSKQKPADFNKAVGEYKRWIAENFSKANGKGHRESIFNYFQPFMKSMAIYVLAFILGCGYWFRWSGWMSRSAFYLTFLAFLVHTSGLIFRMVLEGRPPVTNLYSSAIFVGWGAVALGLILERIYKDGIGTVTASAVGFTTLVIAHNLSLDGDTMIMLQAVLDTNFWLATHVVVITLGYASTFLAGFLAIIYVLRGVLTKTLSAATSKALTRMVYGIICFSVLFSFVGTVLGGIWADQSWGRFWGWDPKENGALLIVIWGAIALHARWGGIIRERGIMIMALIGNIVTGFSWFGVNMLGVGLHTYGFMDQAFKWLMVFNASQLLLIGLALVPNKYWRSFELLNQRGTEKPQRPSDPDSGELLKGVRQPRPAH